MHLGDADDLGDLGLGEIGTEAQSQDLPLALGELPEQPIEHGGVFGCAEAVFVDRDLKPAGARCVGVVGGLIE